ncbi:Nitrogen permease regulator 2 [Tulasnella sp. JGI-2019a]|nr:Nitrogen permease regulator 2 [Tulasnella sp. JGI-2019a]
MMDSLIFNGTTVAAGDTGENFLPRILSVFYATFDARQGPKIVYQVPEGSIGVPVVLPELECPSAMRSPSLSAVSNHLFTSVNSTPTSERWTALAEPEPLSLGATRVTSSDETSPWTSQTSFSSPGPTTNGGNSGSSNYLPSPFMTAVTSGISHSRPPGNGSIAARFNHNTPLLDFDFISEYVIPKTRLCGRLVHCNTPKHRILGFPVILFGDQYKRHDFRYNLCFVFDRVADLSCYEPIVRKCARVLQTCEEESNFLSNPATSGRMYSILEQLYEDLNSYSETSIRIDSFNSIELKLFPFYPNPPQVDDWQVPIALINLEKRVEPNWDITMAKVVQYINGVNHVRKIADLADTDPSLTRKCMEHLLFYQCILMVDIFQYSNMYTLKPSVQWLAEDPDVQSECAPYVTRSGYPHLPWTKLLYLYSRLKPGVDLHGWIEENDISRMGIDVRRFVSFGTIKGFLRRIHRYPILTPHARDKASNKKKRPGTGPASRMLSADDIDGIFGAMRDFGVATATAHGASNAPNEGIVAASMDSSSSVQTLHGYRAPGRIVGTIMESGSPNLSPPSNITPTQYFPSAPRPRQGSLQSSLSAVNLQQPLHPYLSSTITAANMNNPNNNNTSIELSTSWKSSSAFMGGPPTPTLTGEQRSRKASISRTISTGSAGGGSAGAFGSNPSLGTIGVPPPPPPLPYPEGLKEMLDASHHSDELCTKYGVGWKELEVHLSAIGLSSTVTSPQLDESLMLGRPLDLGRVKIIYR